MNTVEKKEKIKIEPVWMHILTTYWNEALQMREPRTMQIKKMTINCGRCGSDFEMIVKEKGVDLLKETEIWTGGCPECFAKNLFSFKVTEERHRMPSITTILRLKSERDGIPIKKLIWGDLPDEAIEEIRGKVDE